MPVLVESLSLVVARKTLVERWPGGPEALFVSLPADRVSDDGALVSFSIPSIEEQARLEQTAEANGLVVSEGREYVDVALIHQRFEPEAWCRWLELARIESAFGGAVMAARLRGDERTEIATPSGWKWQGSRSQTHGVGRLRADDRPLRHLRTEPGAAVYRDRFTGEEVRVARSDPSVRAVLEASNGARHEIDAEVVREGEACALGLMHRESLAADTGMLFLFARSRWGNFWMKNTLVSLDMLFLDEQGRVVELVERAEPMTLEPRGGRSRHRAVLEVPGGWIAAHGARLGDRLWW